MAYSLGLRIALASAGSFAFFLSSSFPLLLWIAPFPFLWLAIRDRGMINLFLIFSAYLFGNYLQAFYTYYDTVFPLFRLLLPLSLESAAFSAILWIMGLSLHWIRRWYVVFLFPTLWVSYLYLSIQYLSKGELTGLPIFSQIQWLPIVQIVSLTGLLGLSFLTSLFSSTLVTFFHFWKTGPKQSLFSTLSFLLIFLSSFIFGMVQLQPMDPQQKIKVGLAAKNPSDKKAFLAESLEDPIEHAREFAATASFLAEKGAQFILQPEKTLWVSPDNQDEIFQILSNSAQTNRAYLFAPLSLVNRIPERNALYLFGPEGSLLLKYNKMHLVAGSEKFFTPGNDLATLSLPMGQIGLAICHDMDFLEPVKDYSKKGVGVLFVPAGDYGVQADGTWHAEVAILQSIAGGFSLVRSAYFGFLSVSDPQGRLFSWVPTRLDQEVFAVTDVPIGSGRTFYARTGDWFPWLNCITALSFLILLVRRIWLRSILT